MTLAKYKTKRRFNETPEPEGKVVKGKKLKTFVIQRHDASHLHYDFRLEAEGVLKSWAVPKGPSLNPADKRLAMMVEDHPVSYGTFEGVIPEGNYGAGFVDVWDHGTYEPVNEKSEVITEKEFLANLKKGSIKFKMKGRKLKGEFALVKMHGRGENTWLLIKHRDDYAVDSYDAEDYAKKSSVKKSAEKKAAREAKKHPVKKAATNALKKAPSKKAVTKRAIKKTATKKSAATAVKKKP
jgi:bifunctional non-homologous end joining protein LigD